MHYTIDRLHGCQWRDQIKISNSIHFRIILKLLFLHVTASKCPNQKHSPFNETNQGFAIALSRVITTTITSIEDKTLKLEMIRNNIFSEIFQRYSKMHMNPIDICMDAALHFISCFYLDFLIQMSKHFRHCCNLQVLKELTMLCNNWKRFWAVFSAFINILIEFDHLGVTE